MYYTIQYIIAVSEDGIGRSTRWIERKWFQLVSEDGNALTSAAAVIVDIEDDALRHAVKEVFKDSHLAGIAAPNLTVFDANGVALPKSSSVSELGKDEDNAIIVQVPQRAVEDSDYFISLHVQEQVETAVFVIVEEDKDDNSIGMGVFFSPTLAVTYDHNLTEEYTVGSVVPLAGRRLVLASFRLGIAEYDSTNDQLGFAPAFGVCVTRHKRTSRIIVKPTLEILVQHFSSRMDVLLVSTKKQSMPSAKELDRKKVIKDRLTDVEESLDNIARSGLAQGCSGLLVHEFKNVGRNNVREIARTLDLHRIPQRIHILNIHDNRSRRRHSVIIFAHELEPLTRQLRD
ncbi:hypothetical protein Plhal703r1_c18g0081891 [Plasmopara halstedii]